MKDPFSEPWHCAYCGSIILLGSVADIDDTVAKLTCTECGVKFVVVLLNVEEVDPGEKDD